MGDALLDRLPPVALRLHLEMAGAGVDIGAGADLEPVPTLLDVIAVEPEIGCVEIGGAVLEAVLAVDLEDPEVVPSRREEVDEEPARKEVLPIDTGHQPRLGVDLVERDRREPLQLGLEGEPARGGVLGAASGRLPAADRRPVGEGGVHARVGGRLGDGGVPHRHRTSVSRIPAA